MLSETVYTHKLPTTSCSSERFANETTTLGEILYQGKTTTCATSVALPNATPHRRCRVVLPRNIPRHRTGIAPTASAHFPSPLTQAEGESVRRIVPCARRALRKNATAIRGTRAAFCRPPPPPPRPRATRDFLIRLCVYGRAEVSRAEKLGFAAVAEKGWKK